MVWDGSDFWRWQETQQPSEQDLPNLPKTLHVAQNLEAQLGCRDLLLGSLSQQPQVDSSRSSQFIVWAVGAGRTDPPI
jgi:hypothetical protein